MSTWVIGFPCIWSVLCTNRPNLSGIILSGWRLQMVKFADFIIIYALYDSILWLSVLSSTYESSFLIYWNLNQHSAREEFQYSQHQCHLTYHHFVCDPLNTIFIDSPEQPTIRTSVYIGCVNSAHRAARLLPPLLPIPLSPIFIGFASSHVV